MTHPRRGRGPDDPWASRAHAWLTLTTVCTAVVVGTLAPLYGVTVATAIGTVLLGVPLGIVLILIGTELARLRRDARALRRFAAGVTTASGRPATAITGPTGLRPRLRYVTAPRPAVIITDTARPTCHLCLGRGGWIGPHNGGEYAGGSPVYCDCWTPWHHTLLPIPRPLANAAARLTDRWADHRAERAGYSDGPPLR